MKLKLLMLGLTILLASSSVIVAAEQMEDSSEAVNESQEQIKSEDMAKVCPICGPEEGMAGKDELSYEHEGKMYYFCSQDCLNAFKENPKEFVEKMDEESHEGHDHKSHSDDEDHEDHDHK